MQWRVNGFLRFEEGPQSLPVKLTNPNTLHQSEGLGSLHVAGEEKPGAKKVQQALATAHKACVAVSSG